MNVQEIREKAAIFGVQGVGRMRKADLVRSIQQAEGNSPCFGAEWRYNCGEIDCCWRDDCMKVKPH